MIALDQLTIQVRRLRRLLIVERSLQAMIALLALAAIFGLIGSALASYIAEFTLLRQWLLAGLAMFSGYTVGWWVFHVVRSRKPVRIARWAQKRVPSLGQHLETAVELAPNIDANHFSSGLLVAQIKQTNQILQDTKSSSILSFSRLKLPLLALLVLVVIGLSWLAITPWSALRGMRTMAGMAVESTPDWLLGPATSVDSLVFDIHVVINKIGKDGQVVEIPCEESGDISALKDTEIHVFGRLNQPAMVGHLVVSGEDEKRYSLTLGANNSFSVRFPTQSSSTWHLEVLEVPGVLVSERTRRQIHIISPKPPEIRVTPPEQWALKAGEVAVIPFSVHAESGMATVDIVYEFPLDRVRTPVKTRILDSTAQTASGEVTFVLPDYILEAGGMVDLIIEASDLLVDDQIGRSKAISFILDSPGVRQNAYIIDQQKLMDLLLEMLAKTYLDPENPQVRHLETRIAEAGMFVKRIVDGIKSVPDTWQTIANGIEALPQVKPENITSELSKIILMVDESITTSTASLLSARLANMTRDVTRLRQVGLREANDEAMKIIIRTRRSFKYLDNLRREWQASAELHGGMLRFTPANLGNLLAQANEQLTAFEDLILRSDTSRAQRRKALEATHVALNKTIEAFRNVNIPGIMPGLMTAKQENVIPPEVLTNLRLALSLQKEVMDRTAQTAFLMRKRSDDLSVQKAPDHLRLASLGQKALEMVERLQQRDNIGDFAQNLLEITGSLSTAVQLLNQGDLKNAASVVEAALENTRNSIIDMRSAAEWAEEEKASKSLLSLAIRLSKSYELLREINSELRLWGQARRAMVTKDDREEASVILRDQERALSLATKFSEALKKSIDSDADEIVVTAFSAKQNMEEACERLRETNFVAAEAHQRQAIQDVMRLRRSLERGEIKYQSASTWAEEDPIELPEHVQTTSAGGFTDEIRNYSDQQVPARFEAVVRAYYDSLMRP